MLNNNKITGVDPGFQARGAHLKKLRRAEGDAKICGGFRVKNHDFTPKNHIFFPILVGVGGRALAGSAPPSIRPSISGIYILTNPLFINEPTGLYTCLHFDQAGFQKHLLTSCFRV